MRGKTRALLSAVAQDATSKSVVQLYPGTALNQIAHRLSTATLDTRVQLLQQPAESGKSPVENVYRQGKNHLVVSSAIDRPIESGTKKKLVAISRGCANASDTIVKCEIPTQPRIRISFSSTLGHYADGSLTRQYKVLERLAPRRVCSNQQDPGLLQALLSSGSPQSGSHFPSAADPLDNVTEKIP